MESSEEIKSVIAVLILTDEITNFFSLRNDASHGNFVCVNFGGCFRLFLAAIKSIQEMPVTSAHIFLQGTLFVFYERNRKHSNMASA